MVCEDCNGTGYDLGSLNPIYGEPCPACNGSGTEPEYEKGDRIQFRDDDTHELRAATVVEHKANGWYDVAVDGVTDDTYSILPGLIRGRLPEIPRKPVTNEQVAEPFRSILNASWRGAL